MNKDEKKEWGSYAEESRWHESLTAFVKTAVREKIERMDGEGPNADSGGQVSDERLDEVLTGISGLQRRLEDLEDETSNLRSMVKAQARADMTEIMPIVWKMLPTSREEARTAEGASVEIGGEVADSDLVRLALERMAEETNAVKRISDGDEVRWYREEDHGREEFSIGETTVIRE
jgi:hypothetical protein